MDINYAYQLLEVKSDVSDDELKIQYKKLAKKYHPDKYKEDPEKFKKINEAYQFIQKYRQNPMLQGYPVNASDFAGVNLNDIFNSFFNNPAHTHKHVQTSKLIINLNLSFADSVLGCKKEIIYDRYTACTICEGEGRISSSPPCHTCNNTGRISRQHGNMIITQTCTNCGGKRNFIPCKPCNGDGAIKEHLTKELVLPPGLTNGKVVRVQGAGHYIHDGMFGSQYDDLNLKITVAADPEGRILEGNNVISNYEIDLLSALEGNKYHINTFYGEKEISVPKLTKHGDYIEIDNCGIKGTTGKHKVKIEIKYPSQVDSLINFLKQKDT